MTLRWPLALGDHLLITSTMKREEAEKLCEQAVRNGGLREREGPKSRKSCGRHPWKVPCPPSLLSVFLPLCKSDFPSLVGLPACLPFPSTCPHLPLPPPSSMRPPGPFQSISNLKFYETKLKLTSHLEAVGTGRGMGTQRPSASPLPTLSFSLSISHLKFHACMGQSAGNSCN